MTTSPSDLFAVSADHGGFTVLLIAWSALSGGGDTTLAYPAMAAGTLGPAALYLALRFCGYERAIGLLLGAALAVAATDVVYSGRLKTYTIDLLIVLGLALIIPRLAQIRWNWRTGIAWLAGAALLAFFSGFALIAVGVAGGILLLHPASDLRVRVPAVAALEAVCVVLLVVQAHTHDAEFREENFRRTWDSFPDFSLNPIRFAGEAFVHFRRVAEYFVGGPAWFSGLCIVVAVIGLAVAAWRGRQAVRARYLLLLLLTVFIAGLFGKFPFGPRQGDLISSGGRVSLWLIPVVAIGLAAALHGLRGLLPGRGPRLGFDAAACVAAVVVIVVGLNRDPVEYPFPGSRSASEYVESQLGEQDAALLGYRSEWAFATDSGLDYRIERAPHTSIGFVPGFDNPEVHRVDVLVDREHVAPEVADAERAFVYYAGPPFSGFEDQLRTQLASTLSALGFEPEPTPAFQYATVQRWTRAGRGAARNLTLSDLPPGWALAPPANPPLGTRVLACMGRSPGEPADALAANGPQGENVISQLDRWPTPSAAGQAVAAFRRPGGAACFSSALEQSLSTAGIPLDVNVERQRPPPDAGPRAGAYHVIASDRGTGTRQVEGSALFFSRGRRSAQLVALHGGDQPFSRALLADLAETLAQRIQD